MSPSVVWNRWFGWIVEIIDWHEDAFKSPQQILHNNYNLSLGFVKFYSILVKRGGALSLFPILSFSLSAWGSCDKTTSTHHWPVISLAHSLTLFSSLHLPKATVRHSDRSWWILEGACVANPEYQTVPKEALCQRQKMTSGTETSLDRSEPAQEWGSGARGGSREGGGQGGDRVSGHVLWKAKANTASKRRYTHPQWTSSPGATPED